MAASPGVLAAGELRSINPATLEVVGVTPTSTLGDVAAAVGEAREAQKRWARSRHAERQRVLRAVARAIVEHADEIAATVTMETGKPLVESFTMEVCVAAEGARWEAVNAGRILAPERLRASQALLRHKRGWLVYEPLGAVAIVSPWNFPFAVPFTQAAAAVAAGNAAVIKPSELTPLSGALVEHMFAEAGVPAGLVRVVQGPGELSAALVRTEGVAKILFTGSVEVGRDVAAAAGAALRPVTLELGGKDPMLVFSDADLERAVAGALWGAFANCGQVCSGVERIYVQRPVFERFVSELSGKAAALAIGRGDEPATEVGPLISEEGRAKVEELVADALESGAEARCGAHRAEVGLPGWFYEPTVLAGERIGGRIADEEVFGPAVTVEPFVDEEEAAALANASRYGLGASVWTRDRARARRLAHRLEAGSVWMNDSAYSYYTAQAAWGGCKDSGFGRTHSRAGAVVVPVLALAARGIPRRARPSLRPWGTLPHRRRLGRAARDRAPRPPLPRPTVRRPVSTSAACALLGEGRA